MIPHELFEVADQEAAELAAAAGPAPLLAAAADPETGIAVLTDLLAHEIASSHRLLLRLAAGAQDVMDWTAQGAATQGAATQGEGADPAAGEAAAARLANAAGRLMEQVRLGLVALRRLRPEARSGGVWLAFGWAEGQTQGEGGEEVGDEELARRLAEARAARAANDDAAARAAVASLSPRAQALRAEATAQADRLAELAGVGGLARTAADAAIGTGFLARLFAHELGAAHGLMMRFSGQAEGAFARAKAAAKEPAHALQQATVAARLGDRYRRGLVSLARLVGAAGGSGAPGGMFWGGPTAGHGVLRPESQAA